MTAVHHLSKDTVESEMLSVGRAAKSAAHTLGFALSEKKNDALAAAAAALRVRAADLKAANEADMVAGRAKGLTAPLLDRLELNDVRIGAIAAGLEAVAALPDPVGQIIEERTRPNGLRITKVRVPIGVIGVIYESRPNVTADAGGLCLKAGNASILRAGSESFHSSTVIRECMQEGLQAASLPMTAIQSPSTTDRAAVGAMLRMSDYIDVIVPRGGKSLIERVQQESKVPVFAHLEGLCHTYVHAAADPSMARQIVLNAKMRRTAICGAQLGAGRRVRLSDREEVEVLMGRFVAVLRADVFHVRAVRAEDLAAAVAAQTPELRGLFEHHDLLAVVVGDDRRGDAAEA